MNTEETAKRVPELMKAGEVSKYINISVSTLHYYEKLGLIEAPVRNRNGYRLFDHASLQRLDFIKKAKMLGFKLDEVKQIIDESKTGDCPCDSVRFIVDKRLEEVDEQIVQMKQFRDELKGVIESWDEKKPSSSVICGLIEEADIVKI